MLLSSEQTRRKWLRLVFTRGNRDEQLWQVHAGHLGSYHGLIPNTAQRGQVKHLNLVLASMFVWLLRLN